MKNLNASQLDIVGSVLVNAGATAVAPSGYDFVAIIGATYANAAGNIKFNTLEPSPGTMFFGTGVTGGGGEGMAGTTANFGLSVNGTGPLIGRWKTISPISYSVIAYIAR
jgi:hypothetical protein